MQFRFEWDNEKARTNRRKHSVSFGEASSVFLDPRMLSLYDSDHSDKEDRWVSLGLSERGRLLVVCHTFEEKGDGEVLIRIFSSRKATRNETDEYGC
jgi:uncharacterized DUF497 family protein